ncbi:hypothetical protein XENOCAPTIV_006046, partial [Xenoophorus captivus]
NFTPLGSQPLPTPSASEDSIPQPLSTNTILSLSTLQMKSELRKIKVRKATGPVGISSWLLRYCIVQL